MASNKSSYVKIIVGAGSTSNSEDYSNCGTCISDTESEMDNNRYRTQTGNDGHDDVAPTYILQPLEITKNIDLIRTVAMLMESKLQQALRGTNEEKLNDLNGDIQRFPEAFQKFTSIIHQIQYLNVTTDWDFSSHMAQNRNSYALQEGRLSFMEKVFRRSSSSRSLTLQNNRKKIMLNLLHDLQRVLKRYQLIQGTLEERLKKFNKTVLNNSLQSNQNDYQKRVIGFLDSDEDDPHRPLLSGKSESSSLFNYTYFLRKTELMGETLRKTKRHAVEVQDSIEVLKELISWDYKQAVSSLSTSYGGDETHINFRNERTANGLGENDADRLNEISIHNNHNSTCQETSNNDSSTSTTISSKRKFWIIIAIVFGILALLITAIVTALTVLTFHY